MVKLNRFTDLSSDEHIKVKALQVDIDTKLIVAIDKAQAEGSATLVYDLILRCPLLNE